MCLHQYYKESSNWLSQLELGGGAHLNSPTQSADYCFYNTKSEVNAGITC